MARATYSAAFELGGIIHSSLTDTINTAKKQLNSLDKMIGVVDDSSSGLNNAFANMGKTLVGMAAAYVSFDAVKNFITGSATAAMGFENAMADVSKVVDGLKTPTGETTKAYAAMSKQLLNMTSYLPMTGEELASITASAGQAGIAAKDLTVFTETAAKMGTAFDVAAQQAGDWMANWRTSFSMSQEEVTVLADQINYLSNTSSENAVKLSGVVSRIGSLGEISGVSAAEVAALAAGMTGVSEEISATGIKNLIGTMNKGKAAGEKQIEVLDRLGLSATDMAERMQTDAQGAILDLLGALKQLPKAEQSAAITNYFGTASVAAIAPLINNLENLEDQFAKVGDASAYAGSMQSEFDARSATTENRIQLMKNAFGKLQISLGNLMLPVITKGAEGLTKSLDGVIKALPSMAKWFKNLAPVIISVAASIAAFTAVSKSAEMAAKLTDIIGKVSGAFTLLAANPALLALAGVSALVGAGIAIWKNYKDSQEEARQELIHSGEAMQGLADNLQMVNDRQSRLGDLKSRYQGLSSAIDSGTLSTDELAAAESELAGIKQSLVELSDGYISTNVAEKSSIDDLIPTLENLTASERMVAESRLRIELSKNNQTVLEGERDGLVKTQNELANSIASYSQFSMALNEVGGEFSALQASLDAGIISQEAFDSGVDNLIGKANEAGGSMGYYFSHMAGVVTTSEDATKSLDEMTESYDKNQGEILAVNETLATREQIVQDLAELNGKSIEQIREETGVLSDEADAFDDVSEAMEATQTAAEQAAAINEKWKASEEDLTAQMTIEADKRGMTLQDYKKQLDDIESAQQKYAESTTNMWSKLSQDDAASVSDMIGNMQSNTDAVRQWRENMESLMGKLDAGLLEQLEAAGPQMAKSIAQIATASPESLRQMNETYRNAMEEAGMSGVKSVMGWGSDLNSAVYDATAGTAPAAAEGMAEVVDAAGEEMQRIREVIGQGTQAAEQAIQERMPAMMSAGQGLAQSFINGIQSGVSSAASAFRNLSNVASGAAPSVTRIDIAKRQSLIPEMATGGVVSSPVLAMIGEGRESEAVMPLSKLETLLNESANNYSGGNISLQVSPTVVIQGNADAAKVKDGVNQAISEALPGLEAQFARLMKNYQQNQRRVSFA